MSEHLSESPISASINSSPAEADEPDLDIAAGLEPHDRQRGLLPHEVSYSWFVLGVGSPSPADDVIPIGEQFAKRWLSASFPQFGPKQHPLDGATDHTGHRQPAGQIKKHQKISTGGKHGTRQLILPFRHPLRGLSEIRHIAFERWTRDPTGPVIKGIQFHIREPQFRRDRRSHRRLPGATRTRHDHTVQLLRKRIIPPK